MKIVTLRTRLTLAVGAALMATLSFAQAPIEMKAVANGDGTMSYDKKELTVKAGGTAPVIEPKKTTTYSFKAPATPAQYVIICTFPGHWKTMNAVLNVVAK